jgi:HTH-type transcriptional regulator / antitoxin HigA
LSEIKPIRSEADYEAALAEVERLWGARSGTPEGDRLDVLATLIDAYESEHHPMDPPDPIEAIKFRMEQQGLSRKDLEGILGTRTRIAEVLNRRRGLSINMIRRLHEKLGISAEVLIRPSRVTPAEDQAIAIEPAGGLVCESGMFGRSPGVQVRNTD